MSVGTKLQEMEVKTQQSKTVVNAKNLQIQCQQWQIRCTGLGNVEDLGGPTPENSDQTMIQIN